jgi:hypothetical protein
MEFEDAGMFLEYNLSLRYLEFRKVFKWKGRFLKVRDRRLREKGLVPMIFIMAFIITLEDIDKHYFKYFYV